MTSESHNVFISHIHEDDEGLFKLKELLSSHDFEIIDSSINAEKPNDAQNPDYIKSQILAPRIQWAGTMLVEAQKGFHRIRGYRELPLLTASLTQGPPAVDAEEDAA